MMVGRPVLACVLAILLAGCAHQEPAAKSSRIIEVESQDMLGATMIATMRCTGDKPMGVRLIADTGTKKTFECSEVEE